jgi:proton-dependent oligopeptide transporter, POT family
MAQRTKFPPVFWVANSIEVLERFAYYGIYMGFGIYMAHLGFTRGDLGIVQSIFLSFSYLIPIISGSMADRFGFKKVLIICYLAYLPSILLLKFTHTFSGIALAMMSIGFAAGIFKPLVAGTVRTVTDSSNKTLGFGIFYAMVNVGASFGPLVMGKLRAISWNHAFNAAAFLIFVMFLITLFFYKEPEREFQKVSIGSKFKEIGGVLADWRFTFFLIVLGVFFWIPFWAFFNLLPIYIESALDTAKLYLFIKGLFGVSIANFLSHDVNGTRHLLGEVLAHTGYIIILFQIPVSRFIERFSAMKAFSIGLAFASAGFGIVGFAYTANPAFVFLGVIIFAVGEMASSPRIQEYIMWLAPKEKAGLYMGASFLSTFIGALFSGIYTKIYGYYEGLGDPHMVWYILLANVVIGIVVINFYVSNFTKFEEHSS